MSTEREDERIARLALEQHIEAVFEPFVRAALIALETPVPTRRAPNTNDESRRTP